MKMNKDELLLELAKGNSDNTSLISILSQINESQVKTNNKGGYKVERESQRV